MNRIWINGKLYNQDEAKVSVYDHGLLYGDGVFEGIRIYSGKAFKLQEHVARPLKRTGMHVTFEYRLKYAPGGRECQWPRWGSEGYPKGQLFTL